MLAPQFITNILFEHYQDGYSVDVNGNVPVTGYMVGGYVPSLIVDEFGFTPILDCDAWLREHWSYFDVDARAYFAGVWTDSETGKIYIDISRNVDDLATALAIATAHGEIAIWDVANRREIRTELAAV